MTRATLYLLISLFIISSTIFAYNYTMNVDLMEARNFVTAREMIEQGNWLAPTMNGNPRTEKPPLPTWLTALSMIQVGSDANLSYNRIFAGVISFTAVIFLFLITRNISGSSTAGLFSALILTTSYMFVYMARKGTWDIFCHSFMLGAIWTMLEGFKAEKAKKWFTAAGVFMALSWMSKGPVSFYVPLISFLVSYFATGGYKQLISKWKLFLFSILIFLVLSQIWTVYLYFYDSFALLSSAKQEIAAWHSRHIQPFWYYLQFPAMSGIWLFAVLALFSPIYAIKKFPDKKTYIFLMLWLVLSVAMLSIIPEKKERYLLPICIIQSIPVGCYLFSVISAPQGRFENFLIKLYKILTILFLIISICASAYHLLAISQTIFPMATLVLSILALGFFYKQKLTITLSNSIVVPLSIALFISSAAPVIYKHNKTSEFMELLTIRDHAEIIDRDFLYSYSDNMKLVWAIGKNIKRLDDDIQPETDYILLVKKDKGLDLLDQNIYNIEKITTDSAPNWIIVKFRVKDVQ